MKKCPVCSFPLPDVAKYCYSCGSKVSKDINQCESRGNDKTQAQRKDGARKANKRKETSCVATSPKKRWKFIVLGILFGFFGAHLAYAKRWLLFLLLWAGFICGNVMNEKKTTDGAPDASPAVQEQNQEEVKPEGGSQESEKKSSSPISNAGFAVWGLLWIGGILFIKKDGNGCRM